MRQASPVLQLVVCLLWSLAHGNSAENACRNATSGCLKGPRAVAMMKLGALNDQLMCGCGFSSGDTCNGANVDGLSDMD